MIKLKIYNNTKLSLLFICLFLLQIFNSSAEDITFDFQKSLSIASDNDKIILEKFLKDMFSSSECGYVLYGNKPICFIGINEPCCGNVGMIGHFQATIFNNGIRIWEKLKLQKESKNFIFHAYNHSEKIHEGSNQFLLINRLAFYACVNENLTLFKYVLGTEITPEGLLKKLTDPNQNFFKVLNNDKVLIGIVLGFGVNNALYVNRQELIIESINALESDLNTVQEQSNNECINSTLIPGYGYTCLEEELNSLNKMISSSSRHLEKESPVLLFGCIADTEESIKLIKHYEEVQLSITNVLDSPDFLEEVLGRFYDQNITHSIIKEDQLPFNFYCSFIKNQNSLKHSNPWLRGLPPMDWPAVAAFSIWNEFLSMRYSEEESDAFLSFIEGMRAAEQKHDASFYASHGSLYEDSLAPTIMQKNAYFKGFKVWAYYKVGKKIYDLDKILPYFPCLDNAQELSIEAKNIIYNVIDRLHLYLYQEHDDLECIKAERYFSQLIAKTYLSMFNPSIKHYLHYQPIVQGDGDFINQDDRLKIRYCIKSTSGYILASSEHQLEEVDLCRTMIGLRKGLEGLKVGSKGILYIHPHLGFRSNFDLPSIKPFLIIELEVKEKILKN